jgi:AMP-binding enzyme C-terminal domain
MAAEFQSKAARGPGTQANGSRQPLQHWSLRGNQQSEGNSGRKPLRKTVDQDRSSRRKRGQRRALPKQEGIDGIFDRDQILALQQFPDLTVTFSIPHPTLGEEVVSAIVPAAGARVEGDELRDRLFDILPTYKVPARILTLKAIPKNESGKVLRRNLPAQLSHLLAPRNDPPRDVPEQKLLVIWRDVLRRHDIGVTDNLFILGADPSRSRVVEELIKGAAMASRLTVADLFRAPTIRQQAALLRERASAND